MTVHASSDRRTSEQTFRRAEIRDEVFGPDHQSQLDRLVEQPWALRAEAASRTAELAARAYAPLERLVAADADAKTAAMELRARKIAAMDERFRGRVGLPTLDGPSPGNVVPDVRAGINVFARPYDFEVRGPTRGEVSTAANRIDGTFSVGLPGGKQHARWATAGVGLVLEATATGVAHVRPIWFYDYAYAAYGAGGFSAHTAGVAKVLVQDSVTGAVLKEQTSPLWDVGEDNDGTENGYIDSWGLAVDFLVQAGQLFTVSFLANAMVDDSGSYAPFGWSLAAAEMDMNVPFIVVELGTT